MILSKRKSNPLVEFWIRLRDQPYLKINIFIAFIILLIIAYSGIFSPEKENHPVKCIHEMMTGEKCISCGLSHSFSLIVRGKVAEAYQWNTYGMRIFIFFASQLLLRLFFSWYYLNHHELYRQLIILDITVSSVIFIISFFPFIKQIFTGLS
jgi:hypothetical protein